VNESESKCPEQLQHVWHVVDRIADSLCENTGALANHDMRRAS
jgi:hypothetical protein